MKYFLLAIITLPILSCSTSKTTEIEMSKGERIILKAIEAHGGRNYDNAAYSFVFRNRPYTFNNDGERFVYTTTYEKNGDVYSDVMDNDGMTRTMNGVDIKLSKDDQFKYSQGLNSVIYFATLPHKLKDKSVNKKYLGETNIKGKPYDIVKVTFNEEGGGKDHEDQYHYWINKETNLIDYFAYNYIVNKGGVRFRAAYNTRSVDGIVFQDYVNYKAEVDTPLIDLPAMYAKDQLKQLSLIETEAVRKI